MAILACVLIAGCTTTNVKSAAPGAISATTPNSKTLLVQPDVQLAVLTAAGISEARADWSRDAQANLATALEAQLKSRSHPIAALDPAASMNGRTGQLLRVNEAFGESIRVFEYGTLKLPTMTDSFDWTLGGEADHLAQQIGVGALLHQPAKGDHVLGHLRSRGLGLRSANPTLTDDRR